jgi:hypothetical protein
MTEADAVDMTSLNDRPSLFSMSSRLYVSQRTLSIGARGTGWAVF